MSWFSRWRLKRRARALVREGALDQALKVLGDDTVARAALGKEFLEAGELGASRALLGEQFKSTLTLVLEAPSISGEERAEDRASSVDLKNARAVLASAASLRTWKRHDEAMRLLERAAHLHGDWKVTLEAIEALTARGRWENAWELLDRGLRAVRRENLQGTEEHQALLRYHQLVSSHLEGAESATVDLLHRGELDARAGVNHLLLARALMTKSPPLTRHTRLVGYSEQARQAEALMKEHGEGHALGLSLLGQSQLRSGEFAQAQATFARGGTRNFALVAGLGAARMALEERSGEKILRLPKLAVPELMEKMVPDFDAMTSLEQRIAVASVAPLKRWLPSLAAEGHHVRVLPLEARVTDLPEFAELKGRSEARDGRSWDAIGGLAGDGLACVKIEELYQLGALNWTLAHELAHLVHAVLPGAEQSALHAAWQRARENEFAFDQYQLSNAYEFFAVSYTMWLCRRYGLPSEHEEDQEGHLRAALKTVERLTS